MSGTTLRMIREARGLTQAKLAKLAKTSQQQIARMELGNRKDIKLDLARRIAAALGCSLDDAVPTKERAATLQGGAPVHNGQLLALVGKLRKTLEGFEHLVVDLGLGAGSDELEARDSTGKKAGSEGEDG